MNGSEKWNKNDWKSKIIILYWLWDECKFIIPTCFRKRKADTKIKTPLPKKIKKEPGISCSICDTRFEKVAYRDAHLSLEHRPLIVDYGCPSCQEQFATLEETTAHNGWHWKTNVPFKCVICDATFPKLITFQKHLSSCVHPSFALTAPFAGNIYCSICKSEFETQNLYDWHRCFISDNSPCPHCSRVFVKRTVLIKHMFRCTGPPGAAPVAPKKVKGKAKKKTAKGAQKVKNRLDIPPQNSFKFEPETIIEQNIDGEDAFDAMDESFMDTHFADSDNEFEPMNSIIPSTELAVDQGEPTKEPINEGTIIANVNEIAANDVPDVGIRANLSHPLLECRVKLEPLDVSNLTTPTITVHPEPVVSQSQPQLTVPPLTIRIKKEVIRPGYGDEFDISLARNIKQERVDETYELASTSTSTSTHRSKHGAHKKSINPEKQKKLYKKPALLAIKIKQERMERETTDDDCNDSYQDYSMPSDDFSVVTGNQSFEATNSLPIITQIHSVIGPSAIVPMANDQLIDQQMPIATNSSETSQQTNNVPFMPIRIKSEFQRPLSPPPAINSEATQQLDENVATANVSDCVESTMMPDITINETGNENNEPENEPEHIDKEPETEVTSTEPQPMECDTSSTLNFDTNLQPSSMVDDVTTLETGKSDDNNITEIENETQPIENMNVAESFVPPQFSGENVASEQNLDENCDEEIILPQNEFLPEQQETTDELFENGQCGDEVVTTNTVENMLVNHETVENEQSIDSMSQHSMNSLDKHLDILSASGHDVDKSEQMLLPIEPPICDDNIAMDTDVTNDNSNISPIDFIEPNTNDDSLNFIDQLVHEVADTMVEQTSDGSRIDTQNDGIPIDTSNMPFEATNFNYSIGCIASAIGNVVDPSPEMHRDESNSKPIENVEKPAADDTLLTLSDIPDIDYDLLPVLNAMEPKSNGNELNTCPPLDSNPTTDEEIANIMQTDAKGDNNQPNSQINE